MAKKAVKQMEEEVKMDMTPMIDCVFLLMIFFVLVIDLSQKELEDLILPKALYAVPDEQPPDIRPIVNISQNGTVIWKKNVYYDPLLHGENYTGLEDLLLMFKNRVAEDKETQTVPGVGSIEIVNDPILIRADKWTEWHYVGKLMTACSKPNIAFWKLELAMSEKDKEEKLFAPVK